MKILIKNGRIIDPANSVNEVADVLVENGKIKKIEKNITEEAEKVIDATNLVVTPGLIDLQVHFREPGREDKETIETGSRAALKGGVTSVVTMPNTTPVVDNQSVVEFIVNRAKQVGLINVFPSGTITKGQGGAGLSEMWEMKNSGAIAVTDDGVDVQDEGVLLNAMEYALTHDMLIMSHCEIENLGYKGSGIHEGWVSTQLGLPSSPAISEDLAVQKNILLAKKTGVRLHLLHNSTTGAVEAIRSAKKSGMKNLTAEVSVQHFSFTDEKCFGYDTNAKMHPPLRSEDHIKSIIEGIKDDTIDCFTTDHAPHIEPEKIKPFQDAAVGTVGLETSFAAANTFLVEAGHVPLAKVISKMTTEPAKIIRVEKGTLSIGADADISIFDPKKKWTVNPQEFESKGKNSVFAGENLTGKAIHVIVGGDVKMLDEEIV